jgi:hypothetical protein
MATTIKLKNSVTTTNAPSSLVQGEVAINVTDKKVWVGNAATTPVQLLGTGAALTCTTLTASGEITQSNTFNSASTFGFKNRIINGAMVIDQRNAGASGTANGYTVDRFQYYGSQASKLTWQQNAGSVTPPSGFVKYLGFTSSSAYSITSTDEFGISQSIEGLNVADLGWGTASASSVTLSFWARSSLTGTFGGSLRNSGATRSYPFTYSISSANTWELKTVTIAGDTSGTWLTTNGTGVLLNFGLGVGSTYSGTAGSWAATNYISAIGATSVVGTNGATFYITGVQLEKGSTATSFDYRPYGTELALCQRYYFKATYTGSGNAIAPFQAYTTSAAFGKILDLPVTMRASPTCGFSALSHFFLANAGSNSTGNLTVFTLTNGTANYIASGGATATTAGLVGGNATILCSSSASAFIDASAEL